MNTKPQSLEPLQGNDLIAGKSSTNFDRRHQLFRKYFACQHPHEPVPPTSSLPSWKVNLFVLHLNQAFLQATVPNEKLSVDEKTLQFHGASKLKSRIKYKTTGDEF